MPLRSSLTRGFAIAALVTLCGTSPALADDGWDSADPGTGQYADPYDSDHLDGVGNTGNTGGTDDFLGPGGTDEPGGNDPARYRGVVTARDGIWLRDQPERGSRRIRFVANGEEVSIYCRAIGDPVDGDRVWYLLTDGTWAWGPAHDIDTLGRTPRWC
ncbi:SH3 domain-containing protein [Streptomyces sp. GbtcB6]|uniref:SH3 domain-containing protein n=1 Tax=Streptomyces sp. GbtcB6 TaxID=2824751 RepID=UPI001C30DCAA|nr:SH3 domain-containing protein [Streptomyces sp. GbtcB6]